MPTPSLAPAAYAALIFFTLRVTLDMVSRGMLITLATLCLLSRDATIMVSVFSPASSVPTTSTLYRPAVRFSPFISVCSTLCLLSEISGGRTVKKPIVSPTVARNSNKKPNAVNIVRPKLFFFLCFVFCLRSFSISTINAPSSKYCSIFGLHYLLIRRLLHQKSLQFCKINRFI